MEIRDAAEAAAGQWAEGFVSLAAQSDRRHEFSAGDAANAVLAAAGYNFRRLLAWPRPLLAVLLATLAAASRSKNHPLAAQAAFFTDDWCVNTIIRIYKMVFLLVNFTLIGHTGSSRG